jgi:hypothetical protein
VLVFLIGCAALVPAAVFVGHRTRRPQPVSVLYALALAVVGAITLPADFADMYAFPAPQFSLGRFLGQFHSDAAPIRAFDGLLTAPEHFANVLLYIPVGILGYLFLGKWWRALGTAVVLTFTVELTQALSGVRDGSARDFYLNCFGAVVGVVVVGTVRLGRRPPHTAMSESAARPNGQDRASGPT